MAPTRQLEAAPADVEETSEALVACEVGNMSLKNTIFATYKILESQGIFFLVGRFFFRCWNIPWKKGGKFFFWGGSRYSPLPPGTWATWGWSTRSWGPVGVEATYHFWFRNFTPGLAVRMLNWLLDGELMVRRRIAKCLIPCVFKGNWGAWKTWKFVAMARCGSTCCPHHCTCCLKLAASMSCFWLRLYMLEEVLAIWEDERKHDYFCLTCFKLCDPKGSSTPEVHENPPNGSPRWVASGSTNQSWKNGSRISVFYFWIG